jgi:hypothetical protein
MKRGDGAKVVHTQYDAKTQYSSNDEIRASEIVMTK